MRKKNNGWQIVGALGLLGYLAWKERRDTKKQQMNQQNFQNRKNQNSQIFENQLQKEPKVSEEEIKKLYHELALKYHPDSAQSERDKEFRNELFKKIKSAYDSRDIKTLRLYKLD